MKICILSEKPSVARSIAAIVGATHKEEGYLHGNGYSVTWAFGHLVQLAMPEDYGFTGFVKENLPIIPNPFILKPRHIKEGKEYKPDGGAVKQLKTIKELFSQADRIINFCDAGREGECIFRFIYSYLDCKKPFDRLWISSLTDKAISEGLQNLKPGSSYDNLYQAAKARAEADFMVGINGSQALSIAAGRGIWSLGRVQTPTLAMICKRYLENKNFVPVPFWQVRIQSEKAGIQFSAVSRERYDNKEVANTIIGKLKANSLIVQSVEKKEVKQEPPLPYDLTGLQKEANSKHGFSADKTLSIAQKLYETHKLVTYPRTGSRYIPDDVFDEIPQLIKNMEKHPRFGSYARTMDATALNPRCVDGEKVTDHYALLITDNPAGDLPDDEKTIYEMIAGRMLEAFSKKCVKDATTIVFSSADTVFEAKGSVIRQAGWRGVFGEQEETGEDETENLPGLLQGEELAILQSELLEKKTRPKPLHTEASLLEAMEMPCQRGQSERSSAMPNAAGIGGTQSCGKDVANEAEHEAIKDSGIGTPATRAAILETLFSRDYIRREKNKQKADGNKASTNSKAPKEEDGAKSLVPTEKGLTVYETVKDKRIADAALTGDWENTLLKIERGEMHPDTFGKAIEIYTRQITLELLGANIAVADENTCTCPKCKSAQVRFYPKVAKCTDANCGLVVFRNVGDKQLTDKQISDLLAKGKTETIKGFKSKAGKTFSAALKFDGNYRIVFDFPEMKGSKGQK